MKLTTHLPLVQTSGMKESYLHTYVCFHDIVLNSLSTGTTLNFYLLILSTYLLFSDLSIKFPLHLSVCIFKEYGGYKINVTVMTQKRGVINICLSGFNVYPRSSLLQCIEGYEITKIYFHLLLSQHLVCSHLLAMLRHFYYHTNSENNQRTTERELK
jgi:hypothetical protein